MASHSGLGLGFVPTAVATYTFTYPDPNHIVLDYVIDFSPGGLTGNQYSIGYAINAIQTARSPPNFAPIAAKLFYVPTVAGLGATYDSLSGDGTSAVQQATSSAHNQFFEAVLQQASLPSEQYVDVYAMKGGADAMPLRQNGTWRAWPAALATISASTAPTPTPIAGSATAPHRRISAPPVRPRGSIIG